MTVLVTGGAGYIGSHVTRLLVESGVKVVVLDNFSTGIEARVSGAKIVSLDLSDNNAPEVLAEVFKEYQIESVIHLAALKQVGQSVEEPELYFKKNIVGLANLLEAMRSFSIKKLVFSSSAATYGMPDVQMVTEDEQAKPINPYGQTKLIGEWMTQNASRAWGLKAANLRYFNVAGAGWDDLADTARMNLIPIVFAALAENKKPIVFGTDYPTPDGSCIRDYVHVLDLAEAHITALKYLDTEDRPFDTFNVGSGEGSSVLEVMDAIKKASGNDFDLEISPRRAGDPPRLVADVSRIKKIMNWSAKHNLQETVDSAWKAINS
jgi:UDP-glucose 4-epimerase